MPNAFHMNDQVRLVIGGPIMTVTNPQGAFGEVWCIWTDDGHVRREAFPAASLMAASAPQATTGPQ